MKHLKSTLIVLLLVCMVLAMSAGLLAGRADARADFAKWANRSARVLEPADYNTSGTSSYAVCSWKGVRGIGNVGIGDGNVSLMKPDVINDLVTSSTQAMYGYESSNKTAGETTNETAQAGNGIARNETASPGNYSDSIIRAPESNSTGNGTLASRNEEPQPAEPGAEAKAPLTESLYPDYVLAASVIPRLAPYSITINKPFEHILNEEPCEAAALYGKLVGLPMPGGQVIDVGIKSIGYEY